MNALQHLPPDYHLAWKIDLAKNVMLMLALNLAGIVLLVPAFWLFGRLVVLVRGVSAWNVPGDESLLILMLVLAGYALTLIVHEGFHGLFFWLYTRSRPVFALKWSYAYAAAPDWFIPKRQYWLIGLAPLIGVSLLGVLLLPVLPETWLLPWLVAVASNVAGAVGDMYVVARLAFAPADTLVNDRGDAIAFYQRSAA
jgi:hypothetical protein